MVWSGSGRGCSSATGQRFLVQLSSNTLGGGDSIVSSFEFVLVALAIVIGFGISQILATWGELLRRRRDSPVFFLQILASSYILGLSLRYLWALWLLRSLDWNYGSFLLAAVPALVLALASHLIKLDPDYAPGESSRQQYLRIHRPLGVLLTLVPTAYGLQTVLNFGYFRGQPTDVSGGPIMLFVWSAAIGLFCWIAVSRNLKHHWIAWGMLWLVQIVVSVRVVWSLQSPAA